MGEGEEEGAGEGEGEGVRFRAAPAGPRAAGAAAQPAKPAGRRLWVFGGGPATSVAGGGAGKAAPAAGGREPVGTPVLVTARGGPASGYITASERSTPAVVPPPAAEPAQVSPLVQRGGRSCAPPFSLPSSPSLLLFSPLSGWCCCAARAACWVSWSIAASVRAPGSGRALAGGKPRSCPWGAGSRAEGRQQERKREHLLQQARLPRRSPAPAVPGDSSARLSCSLLHARSGALPLDGRLPPAAPPRAAGLVLNEETGHLIQIGKATYNRLVSAERMPSLGTVQRSAFGAAPRRVAALDPPSPLAPAPQRGARREFRRRRLAWRLHTR